MTTNAATQSEPFKHLRVLTVLLDVPVPAETGLHIRQQVILRLVRELGLVSHALVFTTADRPYVPATLLDLCDSVHNAGPRVEYTSLSWGRKLVLRGRMSRQILQPGPVSVYPFSIPYDQAAVSNRIDEAIAAMRADVVILPTILVHLAPRLAAQGTTVIGDAADIVSQLTRRVLAYGLRSPWRLPGLLVNHMATRRQEFLSLGGCAELWATTDAEREVLRSLAPTANVLVAGNAVDESLVTQSAFPADGPIGFIGNYSLAPNLDAARLLAEQVLPLVRQRAPGARLILAGAGMPAPIASMLENLPGVQLFGRVEDSLAFVRGCRVMALPIRVRAGLPLKLVEALACGTPVVGTPELTSGLPLTPGVHLLTGRTPSELATAVALVLQDDSLANSLATAGRQRFLTDFSFGASLKRLKRGSVLMSTVTTQE